MSKTPLTIVLLVVLSLFATADYYLNNLDQQVSLALETIDDAPRGSVPEADVPSAPIDSVFRLGDSLGGYVITSQVQTRQLFEKIDLSNLSNLKVYRHEFRKPVVKSAPIIEEVETEESIEPDTSDTEEPVTEGEEEAMVEKEEEIIKDEPIYVYEVKGAKDQGSFTYLNVKLQFIAQINATTETVNEDNQYGQNSFFFNDLNYKNAAFLVTQIGDTAYGFQYSKNKPEVYESIQSIIQSVSQQ